MDLGALVGEDRRFRGGVGVRGTIFSNKSLNTKNSKNSPLCLCLRKTRERRKVLKKTVIIGNKRYAVTRSRRAAADTDCNRPVDLFEPPAGSTGKMDVGFVLRQLEGPRAPARCLSPGFYFQNDELRNCGSLRATTLDLHRRHHDRCCGQRKTSAPWSLANRSGGG